MRFIILLMIMSVIFIASCSVPIGNLSNLDYGMSPQQAHKVTLFLANKPNKTYRFDVDNQPILVERYIMANGDEKSHYYLAYRNNQLIYWGALHEFGSVDDRTIQTIGTNISSQRKAETTRTR